MNETIRACHRAIVDRIADTAWVRRQSGTDQRWAHYERHAAARGRAGARHEQGRQRAGRLARRGEPRVLRGWQDSIARRTGAARGDGPAR
jgi:hypothetical protein